MLSNCNNQLSIKTFLVETREWKNTESDLSIFDLVRGSHEHFAKLQHFVDSAKVGNEIVISGMKIVCTFIDRKAVQINIQSKLAEIDNLKKVLDLKQDQYLLPDGRTVMGNKFGNKGAG